MPPAIAAEPEIESHRALALVAAVGLFAPAATAWAGIARNSVLGVLGAVLAGAALLLLCMVATAKDEGQLGRIDWVLLAVGIAALAVSVGAQIKDTGSYSTPNAALVHGAALRLWHGGNPYGADLRWSLVAFHAQTPTYLMDGARVTTLWTPALPVLLTVPVVALRSDSAAVSIVCAAALCVAAAVMFLVLPRRLRPLAVVVCVDVAILPFLALAGLSAVMMLAALTACAYRWRDVGRDGRVGSGAVLRALALGLAVSVDQLAWFVAPFLLVGTFLSVRRRHGTRAAARIAAAYAAIAVVVFLVVNLPFLVWGPGAWLHGVTAPLTQHALPSGQGLVGLTAFAGIGGGRLSLYGYGALLLYLALLAVFTLRFDGLARCCFLFPLAALYTSDRQLSSYWLVLIGVVLVSALCSGGVHDERHVGTSSWLLGRRSAWQLALFLPALACFILALTSPAPLLLQVIESHQRRGGEAMNELTLLAVNDSGRALRPRFVINTSGSVAGFWKQVRGPRELLPDVPAKYVLAAPSLTAEPSPGNRYVVQAVTSQPRTISSSPAVRLAEMSQ